MALTRHVSLGQFGTVVSLFKCECEFVCVCIRAGGVTTGEIQAPFSRQERTQLNRLTPQHTLEPHTHTPSSEQHTLPQLNNYTYTSSEETHEGKFTSTTSHNEPAERSQREGRACGCLRSQRTNKATITQGQDEKD